MTVPDVHVEVGFQSKITDQKVKWDDVTSYVASINSKRGRNYELDRIEAGTATITFDNADGRFTPGSTTLTVFSERFNALAAIASDGSFLADSGKWSTNTNGTGKTVAISTSGVAVSFTAVPAGGFGEVSYGSTNPLISVVQGQQITVTVQASGTDSGNSNLSIVPRLTYRDAAGTFITSANGTGVPTNGQLVTASYTFTVPTGTGIAYVQPQMQCWHAGGNAGNMTATVTALSVTIASPYAGNVKPRRPIRAYAVADNNWLPAESVEPSQADISKPRWQALNGSALTGNEVQSSFTSAFGGKQVWYFLGMTSPSTRLYDAGLPGYADVIYVKAGDFITASADLWKDTTATGDISITIRFENTATGAVVFTESAAVSTQGVWTYKDIGYSAPADGFVKFRLNARSHCRVANPKLQITKTPPMPPATVTTPSGVFPIFTGYVEKWSQEYSGGLLSEVTAECADSSAAYSGPLESSYRMAVKQWAEDNAVPVYTGSWAKYGYTGGTPRLFYWPLVEAAESAQAMPEYGDLPLTAKSCILGPGTGAFTDTKTIVNADGDVSGGWTNTTGYQTGRILELSRKSNPYLGQPGSVTVDAWYAPADLTNWHTIWQAWTSTGEIHSWLYVKQDGSVYAQCWAGEASAIQAIAPVGTITVGNVYHIGAKFKPGTRFSAGTVDIRVNGVLLDSYAAGSMSTTTPTIVAAHLGRWNTVSGQTGYIDAVNGTINHVVVGFDLPASPHATFNSYGWDQYTDDETTRLNRVLDGIGWPGSRSLDSAKSTLISARWDQGADGYEVASSIAEDAGGALFMGPAGEIVYHNRHRRIGAATRWTASEWNSGLRFEIDDSRVYNDITAERSTGLKRRAQDEDSQAEYGRKALTIRRDVVDPDEVMSAANWLLHRYGDALPRCDTLRIEAHTLNGTSDKPLQLLAYGASLSDRLLMTGLPDTAPAAQLDFFIEGVGVSIERDGSVWEWTTDLQVSDARNSDAWVLEDVTSGVLDSTYCVCAY